MITEKNGLLFETLDSSIHPDDRVSDCDMTPLTDLLTVIVDTAALGDTTYLLRDFDSADDDYDAHIADATEVLLERMVDAWQAQLEAALPGACDVRRGDSCKSSDSYYVAHQTVTVDYNLGMTMGDTWQSALEMM